VEIQVEDGSTHELQFLRKDFDFALRLFSIMDSDSRGQINKATVKEFVTLRCPVFWRRDDDLRANGEPGASPTFEEVWTAVATSSLSVPIDDPQDLDSVELGVEAWMVFCRFIALAQYLEAKRRFSGRHLQQTMRHRNAPRGSELVVVDVPPPASPVPLTALQLAQYERESNTCLPLPELDLDHSLLAAHDVLRRRKDVTIGRGHVKIDLFGAPSSQQLVEFCLTYFRNSEVDDISDTISVRRSMNDLKWLDDTLKAHRTLGGTLCGRILPPFPGQIKSSPYMGEDSALGSTSEALAAAATASVGMLKQGIKSIWGNLATSKPATSGSSGSKKTPSPAKRFNVPQSYYNPNSPAGRARQLERYLNYLLEHPALSTSFPLNTILKASQSGMEAAKQSLDEHTRAAKAISDQAPTLDDGKTGNFWLLQKSGSLQPNLSWVRTAAQAAVALQLHGVLETTGLPSASARLQHASLPKFDSSRESAWCTDDGEIQLKTESDESPASHEEESFEQGILQVDDGLNGADVDDDGNGYDLLPLPVPATERRILTYSDTRPHKISSKESKEARFRYGESPPTLPGLAQEIAAIDDSKSALLGDIAVDENIDKLREVIGSVDHTLSRCMSSSGAIGRAQQERMALHLNLVRGLDHWEGLRGKFVSQRALLKGVSGIDQSREIFEESDLALIDDVSWQTALASAAVSAAEDVRSTVRAARTASGARTAAASAAVTAQKSCDKGNFKSIDEARAAQTRASMAHSHAIHAAVVEHEAKTVKRRATLALAHDVKCWNAHRKREVIEMALCYAKSQHEATRRAVDAWSCLRDGYVGPTVLPSTQTRRTPIAPKPAIDLLAHEEDAEATIFPMENDDDTEPTIVAVDHELLKQENVAADPDETVPETILPLVVASPIPEEGSDVGSSHASNHFGVDSSQMSQSAPNVSKSVQIEADVITPGACSNSPVQTKQALFGSASIKSSGEMTDNEALTSSMQSLVNGLMTWGGQYDDEDFALPPGMAASIALEESGALSGAAKIA